MLEQNFQVEKVLHWSMPLINFETLFFLVMKAIYKQVKCDDIIPGQTYTKKLEKGFTL